MTTTVVLDLCPSTLEENRARAISWRQMQHGLWRKKKILRNLSPSKPKRMDLIVISKFKNFESCKSSALRLELSNSSFELMVSSSIN